MLADASCMFQFIQRFVELTYGVRGSSVFEAIRNVHVHRVLEITMQESRSNIHLM